MNSVSYVNRRSQVETYFDRTALDAWRKLTSDAPVNKIRATVRAGRDRMRNTILSYLPEDLQGRRILDAGCGTGAFSIEAARRGADVLAIDISPKLVDLAGERLPENIGRGSIRFEAGDMLDTRHGEFDHIVAMDSMIHYRTDDLVSMLALLSKRTSQSIIFTHAPRTVLLMAMHAVGQLFPRGNRSPGIVPVSTADLHLRLSNEASLDPWELGRHCRINSGFYLSCAQELKKS